MLTPAVSQSIHPNNEAYKASGPVEPGEALTDETGEPLTDETGEPLTDST